MSEPLPIEQTDPEFAKLLKEFCNKEGYRGKVDDRQDGSPIVIGVKINRNDKCPCGSGKKYKKCCLK